MALVSPFATAEAVFFVAYGLANLLLTIFLFYASITEKRFYRFLQALGTLSWGAACVLNLTQGGFSDLTFLMFGAAHVLVFTGIVFDSHSLPFSRWLLPLPLAALVFFDGHTRLLILTIFTTLATTQLAYAIPHVRLIPLVGATMLTAAAEYFYIKIGTGPFDFAPHTGPFLYIFATIIMLFWMAFSLMHNSYQAYKRAERRSDSTIGR